VRVDIVKATFDVKENGGDFGVSSLEQPDFMYEGCSSIRDAEAREGATL